jgi:hypothetical protein
MKIMKKISLVLSLAFLAVAGLMTSCDKTENAAPSVSFSSESTVLAGDSIKVEATDGSATVDYTYTVTAEAEIASLQVKVDGTGVTVEEAEGETEYTSPAQSKVFTVGTHTVVVSVEDKDGNLLDATLVIVVSNPGAVGGGINEYLDIDMGGSASSFGSYLDAETGIVYLSVDKVAHQAEIDIIFDNAKFWNYDTGTFASGTGTEFAATTISTTDFDSATTDVLFSGLSASSATIDVAVGDVVFFETTGGKKGLIKVNSINASEDLNIDVLVQE